MVHSLWATWNVELPVFQFKTSRAFDACDAILVVIHPRGESKIIGIVSPRICAANLGNVSRGLVVQSMFDWKTNLILWWLETYPFSCLISDMLLASRDKDMAVCRRYHASESSLPVEWCCNTLSFLLGLDSDNKRPNIVASGIVVLGMCTWCSEDYFWKVTIS